MARILILGVVLAVAFTLYSLVDAAMTESRKARGVSKAVWVVICVVLPVIGGVLWFMVGKGDGSEPARPRTMDDEDSEGYGQMSADNVDERIADLEQQLRALDDEVYPGEQEALQDTDIPEIEEPSDIEPKPSTESELNSESDDSSPETKGESDT